jgi:hypothetical protein
VAEYLSSSIIGKNAQINKCVDAGIISATAVGQDFYKSRNPARGTDKPEVVPGQKSASGNRRPLLDKFRFADNPEARSD